MADSDTDTTISSSDSSSSPTSSRWKGAAKAAGRSLSSSGSTLSDIAGRSISPVQFKRGGKVRKTGMALVHKNERVIPAGKRKKVERMMKRSKMRMKSRGAR